MPWRSSVRETVIGRAARQRVSLNHLPVSSRLPPPPLPSVVAFKVGGDEIDLVSLRPQKMSFTRGVGWGGSPDVFSNIRRM